MGYLQPLVQIRLIVVKHNIEIDIPRTLVDDFHPPHFMFYPLQCIQKLNWGERCFDLPHVNRSLHHVQILRWKMYLTHAIDELVLV